MEISRLPIQRTFLLRDVGSIVDTVFSEMDKANKKHTDYDYKDGKARLYTIGKSSISFTYTAGEGVNSTLEVSIISSNKKEYRAMQDYFMGWFKEKASDYNLANIELLKRTRHPKKTKEQ